MMPIDEFKLEQTPRMFRLLSIDPADADLADGVFVATEPSTVLSTSLSEKTGPG